MQLVDKPVGESLVVYQAGCILLNRLDVTDPHHGGGKQQQNHQGEARNQHPEDVLVGYLARLHSVISIAR